MKKYLFLLLISSHASAVYINHQGLGEALIVPYYSVNNNLNTNVSITNTTEQAKAIKINFREGLNGYAVLSYNIYLDAFDTWTFVIVSRASSISGYENQESATHFSSDNSCAPFLNKSGQEFLPYELTDGPPDLSRAREGFIEIIEMGGLQGEFADHAAQSIQGIPSNCNAFESAMNSGGIWHTETGGDLNQNLSPVTGGLMAQADLVDVGEGINFSIPVMALAGFFAEGTLAHTQTGDTSLSLDAAAPEATIFSDNNSRQLSFESGVDAVSAVLMATEMIGTYTLDAIVAGKTDLIMTQPTRRFYFDPSQAETLPPFEADRMVTNCPDSIYGGSEFRATVRDRETLFDEGYCSGGSPCPPRPPKPAICGTVFVKSILPPEVALGQPAITSSDNYLTVFSPSNPNATENGFITTNFLDNSRPLVGTDINSQQQVDILGLPITGFSLHKFSNGGAAPGLLAQYGSSHQMNSTTQVVEQN